MAKLLLSEATLATIITSAIAAAFNATAGFTWNLKWLQGDLYRAKVTRTNTSQSIRAMTTRTHHGPTARQSIN